MDDNVRMTGKPAGAAGAEAGPVTRRRALGDIGINVAAAPAGGKPAVAAKPVSRARTQGLSPCLLPLADLLAIALVTRTPGRCAR